MLKITVHVEKTMTESDFVYLFEDDTKLKILSEFYSLDFFDFVEEEVVGWSPQFLLSSSVILYINFFEYKKEN